MIIVDDREPKMIEHLKSDGVYAQTLRMEAGDFLLGNSSPPVLIERKTWGDLCGSWFSGRVQEQMQKMYATTINDSQARPALLVEGSLSWFLKSVEMRKAQGSRGIRLESIAGMLASIFYDWKVPIIPSQSLSMSSLILKSLDRMSTPQDVVNKPIHIQTAEVSRTDCRLNMLACIGHVGGSTARQLLKKFGSITNIAAASVIDLRATCGHKTGDAIYAAFHDEYAWESS